MAVGLDRRLDHPVQMVPAQLAVDLVRKPGRLVQMELVRLVSVLDRKLDHLAQMEPELPAHLPQVLA